MARALLAKLLRDIALFLLLAELAKIAAGETSELVPWGTITGGDRFAQLPGGTFLVAGGLLLRLPRFEHAADVTAKHLVEVVVGVKFVFVNDADQCHG
ncbi:hypothetical protein [Aeromonas veronii]|uniref:hypothetical protein n=1 Tax=Aeromonas veronii TaxID=654 RepID=UPI003B9E18EB